MTDNTNNSGSGMADESKWDNGKQLGPCPKCAGTGYLTINGTECKCKRCNGSGQTWESR